MNSDAWLHDGVSFKFIAHTIEVHAVYLHVKWISYTNRSRSMTTVSVEIHQMWEKCNEL